MGRKVTIRARERSIQFVFYWQGKQRFESLKIPPTTRNLKAAEKLASQIKSDLERDCFDLGEYFPDSPNVKETGRGRPKTLKALSDRWMGQLERTENTKRKYQSAINKYWLPIWGDRDYRYIRQSEISEEVALIDWASAKSRNDTLTPLRGLFFYAMKSGWIQSNPMKGVEFIKPQREPPDPLEPQEARRVLDWIAANEPHWEPYFGFRLFNGARPGEVHALLPQDARWSTGTIRINKTQTRKGVKETKTSEARDAEMGAEVEDYLRKALDAMKPGQETIFAHPTGRRIKSGKVPRRVWNAALESCSIRHRSSYHTRHTCITMNIMAGANIFWLAGQVGTSPTLIENTYATWIRAVSKGRESSKLSQFWGDSMPEL